MNIISRSLIAIALALVAALVPATAMAQPVCDVRASGARPDDDVPDTAAVQRAIDACRDRGGRVVVPRGRWIVGQLTLGSTMEFHLAPGAVLVASTRLEDFPVVDAIGPGSGHRPFIIAPGVRDLSISGTGTIDGSGASYWGKEGRDRIRFGLIVQACQNVKIRDITVRDTPMFLMGVMDCDNVVVDGVTLTAPPTSPNTDGLQIIDSVDVRISNCLIAVGDDGIVPKMRRRMIERLQVSNCHIMSDDGAIKFGTRSNSGMRDSLFSNITITQSRYGIALFMIHGGVYENIRFDNIRIATGGRHPRHYPIFIDVDDRADAPDQQGAQRRPVGRVHGITFDGIDITTAGNIVIGGHPKSPITDLTLTNIRMRVVDAQNLRQLAGKPLGNRTYRPVPGSPDYTGVSAQIVLGNVEGAMLRGVDVQAVTPNDARPALAMPDSRDIRLDGTHP